MMKAIFAAAAIALLICAGCQTPPREEPPAVDFVPDPVFDETWTEPAEPKDSHLDRIVMAVLWHDVPPSRARVAYVNLTEEFVDWNELRVTVTTEVKPSASVCGVRSELLGKASHTSYRLISVES